MTDKELKPCPFCAHKARHWQISTTMKHIVQCNGCRVRTVEYATREGAFNAWNRRDYNDPPLQIEKEEK